VLRKKGKRKDSNNQALTGRETEIRGSHKEGHIKRIEIWNVLKWNKRKKIIR